MSKLNQQKIKYFGETIYKICSELKIKKPLVVRPDRRLKKTSAEVLMYEEKKTKKRGYVIRYYPVAVSSFDRFETIYLILHELGHIKTKQTGTNFEREYKAERFAFKAIKKHYSWLLKSYWCYVNFYLDFKEKSVYKEVYKQIKRKFYDKK